MFKGPSPFKPFVGSFLFGPLLAQFLAWGKCSKTQALRRLFSWPIVSPKSSFEIQFENPDQSKKKKEKKKKKDNEKQKNKMKEVPPISLRGDVRE